MSITLVASLQQAGVCIMQTIIAAGMSISNPNVSGLRELKEYFLQFLFSWGADSLLGMMIFPSRVNFTVDPQHKRYEKCHMKSSEPAEGDRCKVLSLCSMVC